MLLFPSWWKTELIFVEAVDRPLLGLLLIMLYFLQNQGAYSHTQPVFRNLHNQVCSRLMFELNFKCTTAPIKHYQTALQKTLWIEIYLYVQCCEILDKNSKMYHRKLLIYLPNLQKIILLCPIKYKNKEKSCVCAWTLLTKSSLWLETSFVYLLLQPCSKALLLNCIRWGESQLTTGQYCIQRWMNSTENQIAS